MQPQKAGSIIKPTLDTKFHIDYSWWERSDEDLRQYLMTHLPADRRDYFQSVEVGNSVDYIHPDTAEVMQLDELQSALAEASLQPDFINPQTSLIDSVFRVFIGNGNRPCSPRELADETGRNAETILKTIGSLRVYKGLRPYSTN